MKQLLRCTECGKGLRSDNKSKLCSYHAQLSFNRKQNPYQKSLTKAYSISLSILKSRHYKEFREIYKTLVKEIKR